MEDWTKGETTMPKVIDVSGMRSRPSERYSSAATNLTPSVDKQNPATSKPNRLSKMS
jgi:hypothetical protein